MADLQQIIRNIVALLDPLQGLVSGICFLIGFFMTLAALAQARRRQEMGPGQGGWAAPISTFVTAAAFLSLPTLLNVLNVSLFGAGPQSAASVFSHAESTIGAINGTDAREVIGGLVMVVQFVGIIAVCRGLYLLNQSAQGGHGPKTFGPGVTFLISGVAATNFPLFLGLMESLLAPL